MQHPLKTKTFINSPCRFFHYEPLPTSFFSKNLIIPEAAIFAKRKKATSLLVFVIFAKSFLLHLFGQCFFRKLAYSAFNHMHVNKDLYF